LTILDFGCWILERLGRVLGTILLLAGLFISGAAPVPVHGQAAAFVVDRSTVTPEFPQRITFALDAHLAGGGTITRAEVSYRVRGDTYTRGVVGRFTPGARISATAEVDGQIDYTPPGVTVDYYWTLEDSAGQRFDTASAQFRYDDTRLPWKTRTGLSYHLHWHGEREAFADQLEAAATAGLMNLFEQTGLTLTVPAEIWVYSSDDELRGALPPGEPEWVGGKAFPDAGVILALIADDAGAESEAKRVLPHELAHLVVAQATHNPYNTPPVWLDEGLAVNNQQDGDPFLSQVLVQAARENALLPLRTLESGFPADPDQALLSYAESAGAVRFLLDRYGAQRVNTLLRSFQGGITYDDALAEALGTTTERLDADWRTTLPLPPGAQTTPPVAPGPTATARSVPAGATPIPPVASQPGYAVSGVALAGLLLGVVGCVSVLVIVLLVLGIWFTRRGARRAS
jgi:hypothetical protein